jgi:hypothetical protein
MLVDTDVLIWYLRGHEEATRFLEGLPILRLSVVTLDGIDAGLPQPAGTGAAQEGFEPSPRGDSANFGSHFRTGDGLG